MSTVTMGLLVSILSVLLTLLLFRYEARRGSRIGERLRRRMDFFVLKGIHAIHQGIKSFGRDVLLQTFHYAFHTLLALLLAFIKRWEKGLRNVMRVNKTLARSAERESAQLSKLEEMALHKIATALTEEEKQAHKEKMLEG